MMAVNKLYSQEKQKTGYHILLFSICCNYSTCKLDIESIYSSFGLVYG